MYGKFSTLIVFRLHKTPFYHMGTNITSLGAFECVTMISPIEPLTSSCPSWPLSSSCSFCSCSSFLDCRTEDFSQVRQSPAAGDQILSWEEARQDWIVGNQMVVSTQKLSRVRDPRIICVYKKYSAPRQVFIGLSSSLYQIFGLLFFKHFKLLL